MQLALRSALRRARSPNAIPHLVAPAIVPHLGSLSTAACRTIQTSGQGQNHTPEPGLPHNPGSGQSLGAGHPGTQQAEEPWWRDRRISSEEAHAIFQQRVQTYGPTDQLGLLAIFNRIRSEGEAAAALEAWAFLRRQRKGLGPRPLATWAAASATALRERSPRVRLDEVFGLDRFFQECRHCNAQEVVLEALQRSPELGVVPSVKRFQTVMAWFAQQRAVENCCRLLEVMRAQGLRPNGSVAFSLVKACAREDQDLARVYVEEFRANGIRLPDSVQRYIQPPRTPPQPAQLPSEKLNPAAAPERHRQLQSEPQQQQAHEFAYHGVARRNSTVQTCVHELIRS